MERESFIFYRSFYDSIKGLGDAEFAECMRFLCEYGLNGAEQTGGTLAEVVLKMAKPQIDANNQRRANGAKGGRPKASPSAQEQAVSERKTDGSETENHRFVDYYTANGWRLGKSEMKDWKAVVRNWERQEAKQTENVSGYCRQESGKGVKGYGRCEGADAGSEKYDGTVL